MENEFKIFDTVIYIPNGIEYYLKNSYNKNDIGIIIDINGDCITVKFLNPVNVEFIDKKYLRHTCL